MATTMGACEVCTRTCQLLHARTTNVEFRFFKIMLGSDFNEALFLPPKFAKMVKDMVGQETQLEDSSGIRWTVILSYYKGVLAFHEGWDKFSVDKDLKVGDFLVVNHIKGGHFFVNAFGKDGCEKPNAARKLPPLKKRAWMISENIAAENPPSETSTKGGRRRKSLRTSVEIQPAKTICTSISCEVGKKEQLCMDYELYLMVDRDAEYVQSDYSSCLYDLSIFEMQQNICSPDVVANTSLKSGTDEGLVEKNSSTELVVFNMEKAITTKTIVENNKDSGRIENLSKDGLPLAASSAKVDNMSNVAIQPKNRSRNLTKKPSTREEEGGNSFDTPKKNKIVKTEPVDSHDVLPTAPTSFSCMAVTNGSLYVELPYPIPSVTFPAKREGRAAVILEDPLGREWGGIYHNRFGLYVLVVPWDKINAENGIQPGDRLVFSLKNASLNKFKFDIVRIKLEN